MGLNAEIGRGQPISVSKNFCETPLGSLYPGGLATSCSVSTSTIFLTS